MIKHKNSNESVESFKMNHPAYIDVPMGFLHLAIICARELYEAKLSGGLSDKEWKKLRDYRNPIVHAKRKEDQQIRKITNVEEVFKILNSLNQYLYKKNDLAKDEKWQKHIKNYYKDLDLF